MNTENGNGNELSVRCLNSEANTVNNSQCSQ